MKKCHKFLIGLGSLLGIGAIIAGTSIGLTNSLNYSISSESNNNATNDLASWTTTYNNYAKNHYQNLVKTDLNYYCQNVNTYLQDNLSSAKDLFSFPFYTMYLFSTSGSSDSDSIQYVYNQQLTNEKLTMSNLTFNQNNTSFNVNLNINIDTTVNIYTSTQWKSINQKGITKQNNFTITLNLNDVTIAATIIDKMSNLINQNNQTITPYGGWYINHIGNLNWTESLSNKESSANQTIINDIDSNSAGYNSLNTYITSGTQSNINFSNPSNDDYVACPNTGLLNNTMSLYNLDFNQAINNLQNGMGSYLTINKAIPGSNGGYASYWISNVFNNDISSYDIAINNGKQISLNSITNYDLYAINTSGSDITYGIYYSYQNNY